MIRDRRGMTLSEVIVVAVMMGVLGLISVNLSDLSRGSRQSDAQAYAQAIGLSAASVLQTGPYKLFLGRDITGDGKPDFQNNDPYSLTGSAIQNLRNWPLQLVVENYDAKRSPVWSSTYPDSGFQRIRILVTSPEGRAYAAAEFFKWAR